MGHIYSAGEHLQRLIATEVGGVICSRFRLPFVHHPGSIFGAMIPKIFFMPNYATAPSILGGIV
jgi:hypothetical protein